MKTTIWMLALMLILGGCSQENQRQPDNDVPALTYDLPKKLVSVTPSIEGIWSAVQILKESRPDVAPKLEEIVIGLPDEFRSNYTLMHTSKSNQVSTYESPRVIMFGEDARLIIAYNGDVTHRNSQRLEMMEYDSESEAINLRFIDFGDGLGEVFMSETNPAECATCHGSGPHYIWTSYNQWTGAYGATDDSLCQNHNTHPCHLSPRNDDLVRFLAFRDKAKSHHRYSSLIFEGDSEVFPYYSNIESKKTRSLRNMPNARLAMLLSRRQARLIYRRITESAISRADKMKLEFHLIGCSHNFGALRSGSEDDSIGALKSLIEKAGVPLEGYWQIQRTEVGLYGVNRVGVFDGITSLTGLVSSLLWQNELAKDDELSRFFKPFTLAEDFYRVLYSKNPLFEGSTQFLKTLDGLSAIYASNNDLELFDPRQLYPEEMFLNKHEYSEVCELLKRKSQVIE